MLPSEKAIEIRACRGPVYETPGTGTIPHAHGAAQLGRSWAALLSEYFGIEFEDLPPHLVHLMMGQLKVNRAARPTPKPDDDNYVDAHVYLDLAYEVDPEMAFLDDCGQLASVEKPPKKKSKKK